MIGKVVLIAASLGTIGLALRHFPYDPMPPPAPEPITHTVAWYVDHPADRALMLIRCDNDPGRAMITSDCESAHQARTEVYAAELQKRIKEEYQ